jgi:arylsulfatase A-like enzyme
MNLKLSILFLPIFSLSSLVAQKPNVIIVMTDDQGYGDLGCHGNTAIRTPNIDMLYNQSVRFTNYHADPTCAPSRAALMTGKYSHRVGVWHTIQGGNQMRSSEQTMAEVFKANGYETALFGKWHLGSNYPFRPMDRGFDEWLGSGDGGPGTTDDYFWNDRVNDHLWHNGERKLFEGYNPDVFFDAAIDYIGKTKKGKPFFLYLPTYVPNSPLSIPDSSWLKPYTDMGINARMATFFAMIEQVDKNIGRLRETLSENGLSKNTLLIFLTDNGGTAGVEFYNAGMRGQKGQVYEGGHRVPCFFHWPEGKLQQGSDIANLSAHIDILPTLAELCGLKLPKPIDFDGKSLVPLLYNKPANWKERTLFVETQRKVSYEKGEASAVMNDAWRLINLKELYNIESDPGQQNNVAAQYPEIVKQMTVSFQEYWERVSPGDREFPKVVVGTEFDKEIFLTTSELRNSVVWNHGQASAGVPVSDGEWHLRVAKKGVYEIEVRRWPKEVKATLQGIPQKTKRVDAWIGNDPVTGLLYASPFKSLPVNFVSLRISSFQDIKAVNNTDESKIFTVSLNKGDVQLETRFLDKDKNEITKAYYVYIRIIPLPVFR